MDLILLSYICLCLVVRAANAVRSCPKLKPVPIDEQLLFGKQPPGGFYVSFGYGEDKMPEYTPKPLNKNVRGPGKLCYRSKIVISGREMFTTSVDCSYKSVSAIYCDSSNVGAASKAVEAVGYHVPTAEIGVIVDTDNTTYLAFGLCMDGAVYGWFVFSTSPNQKKVLSRTASALFVSAKEFKESERKTLKTGRTMITKGPCPKVNSLAAGVEAVNDGLNGIFG